TDADPNGSTSDYTAVVTLGDGNSVTLTGTASANGQIVANSGGGFDVKLSYTYAEQLSNKTFSVQVNDAGGATTSASTSNFSVADPPVAATAVNSSAVEGVASGSQVVATFTDPGGAEAVGDYSATINWGDGSAPTTGSISLSGSTFSVSGSHAYAEEGS